MASSVALYTLFSFLLLSIATAQQQSFRPKALLLPVAKDAATLRYVTKLNQRTPLVPINLLLDLGGQFLWVDCEKNYVSSTRRPARCGSAQCSLAKASACAVENNTCVLFPGNPVVHLSTSGEVFADAVSLASTDGSNPGRAVSVPQFLFTCAPSFLVEGLPTGAVGVAGLSRARIALPSQFASAFSFHRKFAMCLSSNGVVFFGDGPYNFLPNVQLGSQSLTFTKLFINPKSTAPVFSAGEVSDEYFIGVTAIKINEKVVPVNNTLLSFDGEGNGGTKVSTVDPYTVLESSIYKAVTKAFVKEAEALNIKRVASIAPFGVCFSSKNVPSTRLGAGVPTISLVLENEKVIWRIFGANSMVQVKDDVLCLGFVDGGSDPRTAIVIGGHQLEDNLFQFDLAASRLGFSSLLYGRRTTCSNFNSTSIA